MKLRDRTLFNTFGQLEKMLLPAGCNQIDLGHDQTVKVIFRTGAAYDRIRAYCLLRSDLEEERQSGAGLMEEISRGREKREN